MSVPVVVELPPNTYAMMVHKLYADRVVDFLTTSATEENLWRSSASSASCAPLPTLAARYYQEVAPKSTTTSVRTTTTTSVDTTTTTKSPAGHSKTTTHHDQRDPDMKDTDSTASSSSSSTRNNNNNNIINNSSSSTTTTTSTSNTALILDTWTAETGPTRYRRGYFLVLVRSTDTSLRRLADLSPMARRNMAWIGRLSHCSFSTTSTSTSTSTSTCKRRRRKSSMPQNVSSSHHNQQQQQQQRTVAAANDEKEATTAKSTTGDWTELGRLLWETCAEHAISVEDHVLRLECHPRALVDDVCLALQTAAARALQLPTLPTEPFEGPIPMTLSRTACTHRLTIVVVKTRPDHHHYHLSDVDGCGCDCSDGTSTATSHGNTNNDSDCSPGMTFFWGLDDQPAAMLDVKLNQEASREIHVFPGDNQTGGETSRSRPKPDPAAPLSRAYYKLEQVWTQILQPSCCGGTWGPPGGFSSSCGLDLGSSPGGWVQALVHLMKLQHVVAVDPAQLATRVTQLPQVRHVVASMETADYRGILTTACSIVVCDASVLWFHLIQKLKQHVLPKADWCVPAVMVVTLKLPFKTVGSLKRQVHMVYQEMPSHLQEMAALMYPTNNCQIEPIFRIEHLMANADSERTLIAIFDERRTRQSLREGRDHEPAQLQKLLI